MLAAMSFFWEGVLMSLAIVCLLLGIGFLVLGKGVIFFILLITSIAVGWRRLRSLAKSLSYDEHDGDLIEPGGLD